MQQRTATTSAPHSAQESSITPTVSTIQLADSEQAENRQEQAERAAESWRRLQYQAGSANEAVDVK